MELTNELPNEIQNNIIKYLGPHPVLEIIEKAWWKAALQGDCDWHAFVSRQLGSYKEKCRKKPKHCVDEFRIKMLSMLL